MNSHDQELQDKLNSYKTWRQQIEVAPGIFTPGSANTDTKLSRLRMPQDFSGKRVLEIGAADGYFSFLAERRGAKEVMAVDIREPIGFNICKELLGSKVQYLKADLYQLAEHQLGQFDVVIFIDVLYHLDHPISALKVLRDHCRGELHLTSVRYDDDQPVMRFMALDYEKGHNRWAITETCLEQLLTFSEFPSCEIWSYSDDRLGAVARI